MSSYVQLATGKDIYGRPWEVGTRGVVMVLRFGDVIRVLDTEPGDSDGGIADRDRFAEAVARAVLPGWTVAEHECERFAVVGTTEYPCRSHEDNLHHFAAFWPACPAPFCRLEPGHRSLHDIPFGRAEFRERKAD